MPTERFVRALVTAVQDGMKEHNSVSEAAARDAAMAVLKVLAMNAPLHGDDYSVSAWASEVLEDIVDDLGDLSVSHLVPRSDVKARKAEIGRIARVWSEGDDEPNDCFAVRDYSGDEWRKFSAGWMRIKGAVPLPWGFVLSHNSPVTEILPSGEDTR